MIKPLNHTFVTLISKNEKPNDVEHFCSISLYNIVYKIITKILTNHLRQILDRVIFPYQSTFIPGRSMADSVIVMRLWIVSIGRKESSNSCL